MANGRKSQDSTFDICRLVYVESTDTVVLSRGAFPECPIDVVFIINDVNNLSFCNKIDNYRHHWSKKSG